MDGNDERRDDSNPWLRIVFTSKGRMVAPSLMRSGIHTLRHVQPEVSYE